jgi:hypothetical protein
MQSIAAGLDARGWLRPGMPASEAGDALLALRSPQVHHLLHTQRGWTPAHYRAWLTETIRMTILVPNPLPLASRRM